VPAYVVFNDRTLAELVARTPRTLAELAAVPGIGPAKLERYGAELLARLADVAA
jgi:superfamily II DNA helicase RecQ